MSKTVILAVNAKYVHSSLSAWILAASVPKYARLPHMVKVAETAINQRSADIAEQVAVHKPDVVGISTYIWNAGKLPEILSFLRKHLPEAIFVLGGPEASHNSEFWLCHGADFVLRGEGEHSFPSLLDALEEKSGFESVAGLCRKVSGEMRANPEFEPDGGDFTDPYTPEYFGALNGKIAYIESSRGCPFKCAFCLSGGSGVRFFPLDTVKKQLIKLSESGTRTIKFVDRTFNCNAKRAYELIEFVIELDTECCFHFEVAADLFDEPLLELLATAPPGRIQLEAGLQSFFEPALKASTRQTDLEKAEKNISSILSGGNIHLHLDLIAGLPHETLDDFARGFDRAYALGAHTLQLGFLKLLYGSRLRESETPIVCAKEPPYEIISSPWLSVKDIQVLKQAENALQHTYNKGRFLSAIRYSLSASGLRPFEFYRALGEFASNHGTPLQDYAGQIYSYCAALTGVEADELRSRMIRDWLGMTKGANMPRFLKVEGGRLKQAAQAAEKLLGRKPRRNEVAVLPSGEGVFADSESRDPVTGLYKLHSIP